MPVLVLHFSRELFPSLHLRMYLESKGCFSLLEVMNYENFHYFESIEVSVSFWFQINYFCWTLTKWRSCEIFLVVFPYACPFKAFPDIDLFYLIFAWSQRTINSKNWQSQLFSWRIQVLSEQYRTDQKSPKNRLLKFFEKKISLDFGANGLKWEFMWFTVCGIWLNYANPISD